MSIKTDVRLAHHQASAAIIAAGLLIVGAVFVFARPAYREQKNTVTVAMTTQHHFSASAVRAAFAAQGIRIRLDNVLSGTRFYGDVPPGAADDAFQVVLYPASAKVTFGTTGPEPMYATYFGNVAISYGGHSKNFAEEVAAAADSIRRSH